MTGIYDSDMTERERRLVYDAKWCRLQDALGEAHLKRDDAAMDRLWRAIEAREADLMGGNDVG